MEPTAGVAPASIGLQNRCLAVRPRRQARARGFEPRPPVLEAGYSPRSTLVYAPPAMRPGMRLTSFLQFSVPVHIADELRPAFQPDVMVGIHRLPRRPHRLASQRHAGLARRAVRLSLIAGHAGQHAVRPARHATLRSRHYVVDRKFVDARLAAAILAYVMVALEHVAAT